MVMNDRYAQSKFVMIIKQFFIYVSLLRKKVGLCDHYTDFSFFNLWNNWPIYPKRGMNVIPLDTTPKTYVFLISYNQ